MSLRLRQWPVAAVTIGRTFGARGLLLRALHELRRKTNSYKQASRLAERARVSHLDCFKIATSQFAQTTDRDKALERAERVVAGKYFPFRNNWNDLPDTPASWHTYPGTGVRVALVPWWKVGHMSTGGDIKELWEPARFGWVYDLVRAHLITDEARFGSKFEDIFDTWYEANPPFLGVHWSCGQETTIRAVALLYAEANLELSSSAAEKVARVLAASGERIADAIGYAISQRNNHGISEALGLIALGARFMEHVGEAKDWYRQGVRTLEMLIISQFADDGWYIQHSFNYTRLALEQCVLAENILRSRGSGLSALAKKRIAAAFDLLTQVVEPTQGSVPNYGQNDGAYVLPITLADYGDYRPLLTEIASMFGFSMPRDIAPWAEATSWLGVSVPGRSQRGQAVVTQGQSGWVTICRGEWRVFVRAGAYRSRPGHIDPLQVDIRHGAAGIIVDPGTFSYNAPPPWKNSLVSAGVHNTPVIDGQEPGIRGPRFLWYRWPNARILAATEVDDVVVVEVEIPNEVVRRVEVAAGQIRIIDTVTKSGAAHVAINWLLAPRAEVKWNVTGAEAEETTAFEQSPVGWYAPFYGQRTPSRYVRIRGSLVAEDRQPIVTEFRRPVSADNRPE